MKKFLIIGGLIFGGLVFLTMLIGGWFVGRYNTIVTKDQAAQKMWSQVENQYQRRYDLIPNLVETVKGYAAHEKETFVMISQARASVGQIKVDGSQVPDPQNFEKFAASQQTLGTALSRLMMIQEKYPELKADAGFRDMRAELAGTENRIAVARMDFNEKVGDFNTLVKSFPGNVLAGMFNFKEKPYFQVQTEEAKSAPKVSFK